MYGIVEINGHQYKVKAGDIIDVEKLEGDVDSTVTFENVLFTGGDNIQVGTPTVSGAKITAKIVRQARSRKQVVLTRKPGKYVKKNGHRQHYTGLFITEVNDGKGGVAKAEAKAKKETAKKETKKAAPKKAEKKAPAKKKATKKTAKKTAKKA